MAAIDDIHGFVCIPGSDTYTVCVYHRFHSGVGHTTKQTILRGNLLIIAFQRLGDTLSRHIDRKTCVCVEAVNIYFNQLFV